MKDYFFFPFQLFCPSEYNRFSIIFHSNLYSFFFVFFFLCILFYYHFLKNRSCTQPVLPSKFHIRLSLIKINLSIGDCYYVHKKFYLRFFFNSHYTLKSIFPIFQKKHNNFLQSLFQRKLSRYCYDSVYYRKEFYKKQTERN